MIQNLIILVYQIQLVQKMMKQELKNFKIIVLNQSQILYHKVKLIYQLKVINQFLCYFIQYIIKYSQINALDFIQTQIQQLLYFKVDTIFSREVEQNGNYWILTQPEAQRIAKCLIQQQQIAENQFKELIDNYCQKIKGLLISNLKVTLICKAIYLLLALIENTNLKEQVLQDIKKNKKWIDKLEKTQSLQILYKYI
ncbi:unnamed protein product [Paramecium sonneborni]|uniref:Uncharacterized protein n=1 Tax=Paramecium sonneborni TaxID=65129 RepID=A0A8S1RQU5_9CILI|nr:unnamed protein product [Paramecium sonneborni]